MKFNKSPKNEPANAHSSKPFFNKNGEEHFLGTTKEEKKPFFSPANIQPKLAFGQPNDPYEQEADFMAEKVSQKIVPASNTTPVQRKEQEGEEEPNVMQKSIFESQEDPSVQTKSIESTLSASKGKGRPLSTDIRSNMEPAFGTDFSKVRVHDDAAAVQMNENLNSRAFTNGNDVYFNKGEYDSQSKRGLNLIAHELTHVRQQNNLISKKEQAPAGTGKALPDGAKEPMEQELGIGLDDVQIHNDKAAHDFAEGRNARAVTMGKNIYLNEGEMTADDEYDDELLAHELVHVKQQKSNPQAVKSDLASYQQHEQQAHSQASSMIQRQPKDGSNATTDDKNSELAPYLDAINKNMFWYKKTIALEQVKSVSDYKSLMDRWSIVDAKYVKGKLYEDWVDDGDERSILSTLETWAHMPLVEGGNYLDRILDYLKNNYLVMNYFLMESPSVSYLDQLFEDIESPRKKRLYHVIDNFSTKYSGYRGRGGVSVTGSFNASLLPSELKGRISSLNAKLSGMTTVPMTDDEAIAVNRLYARLKKKSLGLINLPPISLDPAAGQNAAQVIAVPAVAVYALLAALVLAVLYVLLRELIKQLLDLLDDIIDRARTRTRTKTRTKTRRKPKGKPLKWNSTTTVKKVISSKGVRGALDANFPLLGQYDWHAHHPWPKFMGGAPDQRLMGVRNLVHLSILHPALVVYLKGLGHKVLSNQPPTHPTNGAFITKMRTNPTFKATVMAELIAFYAMLNLKTSPKMPASAYTPGITDSFAKL